MPLDRSSGLLLHISSLDSVGGIGDFGPAAYAFADFLAAGKQRLWQVLPLNPVGYGSSPYSSISAFAGNPLFISLELLVTWGWLEPEELVEYIAATGTHPGCVDFELVRETKMPLLERATQRFLAEPTPETWQAYQRYCAENSSWLEDFVLFNVLRREYASASWNTWPAEIAHRDPATIQRLRTELADKLNVERVIQFAFDRQWAALRHYSLERGIRFVGDVAIFVSYDSADVWTHPELFELREDLSPIRVSGVPPDYFSVTGQRWGNPLYRWDVLAERKFDWWVDRTRRAHQMYDIIRLDHFRGFEAYWAIPAEEETAVTGEWVKCPGAQLFWRLREVLGEIPFIAEDLGMITPEVEQLRAQFGYPGMRILQFGFGDRGAHNYLPHRYERNTVVYTGTHDNNTTAGWWAHGANDHERAAVRIYTGTSGEQSVVWPLIRAAAESVADTCIFPLQDVLELGSDARMNTPAEANDNWSWRVAKGAVRSEHSEQLAALTELTDRDGVESSQT
ncbi:MAG: 4-alpha-glucanotransferase [Acidobacteriaceae bacterium]|nr:4-alpha-glucanotransferase [Acidobacteriaceae bacterium]